MRGRIEIRLFYSPKHEVMNNLKLHLLLLLVGSMGLWGCDFLGYNETTSRDMEAVFTDVDDTERFVTNIYAKTPSGFNSVGGGMRASASDIAEEVNERSNVQRFNDGTWSPINSVDASWGQMYGGIRAANLFLREFDIDALLSERRFDSDYDALYERYSLFPYEARFLRAYFYFELARRYGGVPLVTDVLDPAEADTVSRASFDEVVDFIVAECDTAAANLPANYGSIPQEETGRATRGAALALKARILLYAASPLHNPSGDRQKWIEAARAAKAVIDLNQYSLEGNYADIFNNRESTELIWERRQGNSNSFERSNFPVGYEGANPGTAPTQNLVSAYDMQSTGMDIDESGSGYDPDNPYEDRDPRLHETVIVNNSTWKGRKVQIWDGGLDGPPQERATQTGYYLKKYVDENISLDPNNTTSSTHTWVLFRYGGVLLDYAEAMNEAYGPENPGPFNMTARQAVNQVRTRVNMPPFPSGMSQSAFRTELREERMVELAFEDHRFWDIRRWKIGPSTQEVYGVEVEQVGMDDFDYETVLVEDRVWTEAMNLYPIPQNEVFINDNLKQNPGW